MYSKKINKQPRPVSQRFSRSLNRSFWIIFHEMPCQVIASRGWRDYFEKYFDGGLVRFANRPVGKIQATMVIHNIKDDGDFKNGIIYNAVFDNLNCQVDTRYLDHSVYPMIANTLQKLFTRLIYKHEGFVIHASSVVRNKRAFLFLGNSGAGKTSAARISIREGYAVLSDNFTFVIKRKHKFMICPFPFDQFSYRDPISPIPISACFLLNKSKKNIISEIPDNSKVKALNKNNVQLQVSEDDQDFGISLLFEFIYRVKIYDLHFSLKGGFWRLV